MEGGQTPIMMRSPKLGGFSNFKFMKTYEPVNVEALNVFEDGAIVALDVLLQRGLVHGPQYKILGDGDLDKKLVVHAPNFSKSAMSKIEAAGGSVVTDGIKTTVGADSDNESQ